MNNQHLYQDELIESLNQNRAEELEDEEVIEGFLRWLDVNGWNMWIIKAIRSLLGMEK